MTPADLRAWQAAMGYTYETAAVALGVSRATYAGWLSGISRTTGAATSIDRRTALACAALVARLEPWTATHTIPAPVGLAGPKKQKARAAG